MPFSYPFTTTEFEVLVRTSPSSRGGLPIPAKWISIPCQEVEGLGSDVQMDTYFEGNNRAFPLHLPKNRMTGELKLRRGEDASGFFLNWHQRVIAAMAGDLRKRLLVSTVIVRRPFRDFADGQIKALDVILERAWPKEVTWSGFNASATEVWFREVVLVYRSLATVIRPL
jgi:phage tail-like protein